MIPGRKFQQDSIFQGVSPKKEKMMLVRFTVENYKSINGMQELSMVASKKEKTKKRHLIKTGGGPDLLPIALICGGSTYGKSNLISAFTFLRKTVESGLSASCKNDYFHGGNDGRTRESVFELQFLVDNTFYAYGFSAILCERRITEEWLYELLIEGGDRNIFLRPTPNERIDDEEHLHLNIMKDRKECREAYDWIMKSICQIVPEDAHKILSNPPGRVLIVDNLDETTGNLLKNYLKTNMDRRAQLVFTTHDISLLDSGLFRRDEVWFTDKFPRDGTHIYALDRFKKTKFEDNLSKSYLNGRFGAV